MTYNFIGLLLVVPPFCCLIISVIWLCQSAPILNRVKILLCDNLLDLILFFILGNLLSDLTANQEMWYTQTDEWLRHIYLCFPGKSGVGSSGLFFFLIISRIVTIFNRPNLWRRFYLLSILFRIFPGKCALRTRSQFLFLSWLVFTVLSADFRTVWLFQHLTFSVVLIPCTICFNGRCTSSLCWHNYKALPVLSLWQSIKCL